MNVKQPTANQPTVCIFALRQHCPLRNFAVERDHWPHTYNHEHKWIVSSGLIGWYMLMLIAESCFLRVSVWRMCIYIYIYHISQFKPKLSLGSFKLGNDDKSSWHHIGSWNLVDCSLGSVDLISFSQPPLKLRKPCKATRINQKEYIKKIPLIAHMFLTLKWQNPCKPQNEQSAKYANLILLLACCLQLPKSNQWHQCQKNQ